MNLHRPWKLILVAAAVTLLAASCGADTNDSQAGDSGLETFRQAGCSVCHGDSGGGGVGPAMGGHRAEQVIRQVRAPLGAMPLFETAELSDSELDLIVEFVVGLDPVEHGMGHGHGDMEESDLDPRDVLAGHHWMALSAMLVGDVDEALHHIEDISAVVEGEHAVAMNEIVALLGAGDLDTARAKTTEMMAGFVPGVGTIDELHLRLALQALAVDDSVEAMEHLGRVTEGAFDDVSHHAVEVLEAGELQEAKELIEASLGEAEADHEDGHAEHEDGHADHEDHDDDHGDDHGHDE